MPTPMAEAGWEWIHEEQAILVDTAVFSALWLKSPWKGWAVVHAEATIISIPFPVRKCFWGSGPEKLDQCFMCFTVGEGERECQRKAGNMELQTQTHRSENKWMSVYLLRKKVVGECLGNGYGLGTQPHMICDGAILYPNHSHFQIYGRFILYPNHNHFQDMSAL